MNTGLETQAPSPKHLARIVEACQRCQERKSRCDGRKPTCSSCVTRETECVYRGLRKRRGPGKSKQHIQAMEKRLSEMENLLHQSIHRQQIENEGTTNGKPSSKAYYSSLTLNCSPGSPSILSDHHSNHGDQTSRPNPKKTKFAFFQQRGDHRITNYRLAECGMSLSGNIENICNELPLFTVPWLLDRLGQPNSLERKGDAPWWASINALIAMLIPMKIINSSFRATYVFAWAYFKNAYATFPELVVRGKDLSTVQCFIIMATFMRGCADTRTAALLLSAAVRVSQSIGLHRKGGPSISLDGTDKWSRSQAFWIAYTLDIEMSLYCGLPPLHSDEDIEINPPEEALLNGDKTNDLQRDSRCANVFATRVQLAIIQSRVRRELFAAKSLDQAPNELLGIVSELDFVLENWRSRNAVELWTKAAATTKTALLDRPVVVLYLTYHNCVSMIQWAVIRHGVHQTTGNGHCVVKTASVTRVRMAARATIDLLQRLDLQPFENLWRLLCYPLSAIITLLATVLHNPAASEALADLMMMRRFVQFLKGMVDREDCDLAGMMRGCSEMDKIATYAIECTKKTYQREGSAEDRLLDEQTQAVASWLRATTHPMYVAQCLIGNLSNRDEEIAHAFSDILGMPWEANSSYGPFVPDSLRPDQNGFKFDA